MRPTERDPRDTVAAEDPSSPLEWNGVEEWYGPNQIPGPFHLHPGSWQPYRKDTSGSSGIALGVALVLVLFVVFHTVMTLKGWLDSMLAAIPGGF